MSKLLLGIEYGAENREETSISQELESTELDRKVFFQQQGRFASFEIKHPRNFSIEITQPIRQKADFLDLQLADEKGLRTKIEHSGIFCQKRLN